MAGEKTAVTERACDTESVHAALPEQSPNHPANCCPLPGTAESVTDVPVVKLAVQVAPQLIPVGLEVTVPTPLTATLNAYVEAPGPVGAAANVAATFVAPVTMTVQVLVPEQAPDHATKTAPAPGVAVSVTWVPEGTFTLQVLSQDRPLPGALTEPKPVTVTVKA